MKLSVGGQSLNYNLTPFNLVIQSFSRRPLGSQWRPPAGLFIDANALIIKRAIGVHIHITVGSLLAGSLSYARRQLRSGLASLRGAALTAHSSRTLSISHTPWLDGGPRADLRGSSVQISLSQLLRWSVRVPDKFTKIRTTFFSRTSRVSTDEMFQSYWL
jgi:hypothetical protein